MVFGESHLRGMLKKYAAYYNAARTHLSLQKDTPEFRLKYKRGRIVAIPFLGGLHHQYVRVWVLTLHNIPNGIRGGSL